MKHAAGPRKEIGARTIFNILGPLTNPAGATCQLLGVFDPALTETMANVLGKLGTEHALVVSGPQMVDELTASGPNKVSELREGQVRTYVLDATQFGMQRATLTDLIGGSPEVNASITRQVLENQASTAQEDVVVLNAGAALYAYGAAPDVRTGVEIARESIRCGHALRKLNDLAGMTHRLSTTTQ